MGRIMVALAGIGLVIFMWGEAASYPPTARKLPDLLGWVVLILAVLAIAQEVLQWGRARLAAEGGAGSSDAGADDTGADTSAPVDWRGIGLGAAFVALIVVYARTIEVVGYMVATPLFLALPLIALRPVSLRTGLLTIVAVTAVIYGVFVWFLRLNIPLFPAF